MLHRETKIVDLVGEHLQTFFFKKKREGGVVLGGIGAGSRRERREEEGAASLMRANLERGTSYLKQKIQINNQQVAVAAEEEMNGTT